MELVVSILIAALLSAGIAAVATITIFMSKPREDLHGIGDVRPPVADMCIRIPPYIAGDDESPGYRLQCWGLFNRENASILQTLRRQFVDLVNTNVDSEEWRNIQGIFPISTPAYMFFDSLKSDELISRMTAAPDTESSTGKRRGMILFDLSINSGGTIQRAVASVNELGWDVVGYWTVLFNDVNYHDQSKIMRCLIQKSKLDARFLYLYKASDLIQFRRSDPALEDLARNAESVIDEQCRKMALD